MPRPPSSGKPKSSRRRLLSAKKTTVATAPSLNKNNPLPPVRTVKHSNSSRAEIRKSSSKELHKKSESSENVSDSQTTSTSSPVINKQRKRTSEKQQRNSPNQSASRRTPLENLSSTRLHRSYTNLPSSVPVVRTPGPSSVCEDIRPSSTSSGLVASAGDVRITHERSSLKTADPRVTRDKSSHKAHEARIVTELVNQANREGKISDIVYTTPRDTHTGKGSGRSSRVAPGGTISFGHHHHQALNTSSTSAFMSTSSGERMKTPDGRKSIIVSSLKNIMFYELEIKKIAGFVFAGGSFEVQQQVLSN